MQRMLRPKWTCEVVAEMHRYAITRAEVAKEIRHATTESPYTAPYISQVLSGSARHKFRDPQSEQRTEMRIRAAVHRLAAKVREEMGLDENDMPIKQDTKPNHD